MSGSRRHAQCVHLLPGADASTGNVRFQSLRSNVYASSLHSLFLVEFESPAKVYEQLLTARVIGAPGCRKGEVLNVEFCH